jgi:hypothetical protein
MATMTLSGSDLTLLGYTVQVRDTESGALVVTLRNESGRTVNAADLHLQDAQPRELVDEFDTLALISRG